MNEEPMRRREDPPLLRGEGRFVADRRPPGFLELVFLRSPVGSGLIRRIDTRAAVAHPGVVAVFTAKDLPKIPSLKVTPVLDGIVTPEWSPLAGEQLEAVGQPVAAIVAKDGESALDALEMIDLEIEASPPQAGDPILAQTWEAGDIDTAFRNAALTVSATITHPRLAPSPLEPRGVVAEPDPDSGDLQIQLSTQTPHRARNDLARMLGLHRSRLHVATGEVGGAFGMKASLHPEEVVAVWAAQRLGRPVRWIASRSEEFLSAAQGRGTRMAGRLAVDAEGRFLGLEASVVAAQGHWMTTSGAVTAWNAARILPGPYRIGHLRIRTEARRAPLAAVGIYRGAGRPEACALMERLVEKAARALGIDRGEIRRRNLIPGDAMPYRHPTGPDLDTGDFAGLLDQLDNLDMTRASRKRTARRRAGGEIVGTGIALYVEPCGRGAETARITLEPDGRILAATGGSSQGHGRETAIARIVADELDVDPCRITVLHGDTRTCPEGVGALASRSTPIGGSAMLAAARSLRKRCPGLATTRTVTVEESYESAGEAWGSGACHAEVRIDGDTGALTVAQIVIVDDCGPQIDPALVRGQLAGGIAQGFGEAAMERIAHDGDGELLSGSFMDYALPRAADMPAMHFEKRETPTPRNLLGTKGVGEAGTIAAPAAILNAVMDALAPFRTGDLAMPLTSETLWRAIHGRQDS